MILINIFPHSDHELSIAVTHLRLSYRTRNTDFRPDVLRYKTFRVSLEAPFIFKFANCRCIYMYMDIHTVVYWLSNEYVWMYIAMIMLEGKHLRLGDVYVCLKICVSMLRNVVG